MPSTASARIWPRSRSISSSARQGPEDLGRARCRPRHQSDAGRRPDRGRHRAGPRPGADGGVLPRPRREPARLSDPDHRRHAAGRVHPDRGCLARRPVRRQGHRRAGADPDRAGDPQRHPPCDRRADPPRARRRPTASAPAITRARTAPTMHACPEGRRRQDPLRRLSGDVLHPPGHDRRLRPLRATRTANWSASIRMCCSTARSSRAARSCRSSAGGRVGRRASLRAARDLRHRRSAPAPPIPTTSPRPSSSPPKVDGVDMVTVVTEGIFSYCGVKVKIDTDRHLGPERATVRAEGEPVGHVTTGEYGSQMLSLGGVQSPDRRRQEGGPRHLRYAARALQRQGGRACDRRRRQRGRAGRQRADRQRHAGGAHARRLRLGDDRHVRQAMVRQGRRGGGRRRPHHRRPLRASGREGAGHAPTPASG